MTKYYNKEVRTTGTQEMGRAMIGDKYHSEWLGEYGRPQTNDKNI